MTPDFVEILCFSSPLLTALQQGRWNTASLLPRGSESPGLHVASAGHWGEAGFLVTAQWERELTVRTLSLAHVDGRGTDAP